jgi:hypothetical protein
MTPGAEIPEGEFSISIYPPLARFEFQRRSRRLGRNINPLGSNLLATASAPLSLLSRAIFCCEVTRARHS